jgi:NTP pyrophosphatase (non-canonical NTP hydrolase)
MNKEINNFIRLLSKADTKSLMGKGLKTSEEVGELAKAILPFENAAGTLHRFVDRANILENVADVYLSAISIAHHLDFTDEEIEEMILRKATKWQDIQRKEQGVKFPIPFEIHITVARPDDVNEFKKHCEEIKVKPIIIDLEKNDQLVMQDVMTSSVHFGDNRSAYEAARNIEADLFWLNYQILRVKIETVPWHPAAPSVKDDVFKMPPNCYFESHLRIVTTNDRRQDLQDIAKAHGAHLSRNFFKKLNDNEYIIMMTLRDAGAVYEHFKLQVEQLKEKLQHFKFVVDKTEIEFAVYDTKNSHDAKWLQQ